MNYTKTAVAQADMVDGNLVVMNGATMSCFLLNDLAGVVWDAIDHFSGHDDLLALLREAGVPEPDAALDGLMAQLLELGLVEATPA